MTETCESRVRVFLTRVQTRARARIFFELESRLGLGLDPFSKIESTLERTLKIRYSQ